MTARDRTNPVKQIRAEGDSLVVEVVGDVDVHRSASFQRSLMSLLDESPARIVLDLASVRFIDSSGLAGMVKLLGHVRRLQIDLRLCRPTRAVRSLLEITRLDSVFTVCDTLDEALA